MTYADDSNLFDMVLEALRLLAGILLGHVVGSMSEYLGMEDDQDIRCGVRFSGEQRDTLVEAKSSAVQMA